MSSFFKKKSVITAGIITAIVLLITIISHFIGFNPVNSAVRTVLSPFRSGMAYISDKTYGIIEFIWEMDSYREENSKLNSEIAELRKVNRDVSQYREENERLKELLNLQQSMSEYSTVAATVIGYSENDRYDTIEISKGLISGVSEGNTVITADGVVGIVTEAGPNWAIVQTIIDRENAMGIKITRTGDAAVLEGDEALMLEGQCKMTFINSSANIIAGDLVETSGSAGIYPAGLLVGSVTSVNSDNIGQLNYAVIEPSVDFSRLREVLVINGVN